MDDVQKSYYYYSKTSHKEQSIIYEKMGKRYKCPKVNYGGILVAYTNKSLTASHNYSDAVLVAQGYSLTEF